MGALPGLHVAMRQRVPVPSRPRGSSGSSPARTRLDLPEPDGPMTAKKCWAAKISSKRSVCASRPKKISFSQASNGRSPG